MLSTMLYLIIITIIKTYYYNNYLIEKEKFGKIKPLAQVHTVGDGARILT